DGHHWRPRMQVFRAVLLLLLLRLDTVLLLTDRLEAELVEQQLDLVEVEALIDGDHQPEVLESGRDDLRWRHIDHLGDLRHGEELVHPNGSRLLLPDPLLLLLTTLLRRRPVVAALPATTS